MCFIHLTSVSAFLFWIMSVVPNLMPWDMVTKIATLLMNMMSMDSVIFWGWSSTSMGTAVIWAVTWVGVFWVVLPFRAPTSGPKTCLAACISCRLMRHPGRSPSLMYQMKSFVLGWPIVHCTCCARVAREYSSFV